jgi:predicted DCC family thiol-disulfide oxidoreductase YuxK
MPHERPVANQGRLRWRLPSLREIRFLDKRDHGRGRIQFEDIAEPSFDPGAYGLDARDVVARIHGVLPDGTVVEGVEVFRRAYAAVGLGWLMVPTRWPGLRRLAELAYRIFARNRLRWTGRASACEAERCQVVAARPPASSALESESLGSGT